MKVKQKPKREREQSWIYTKAKKGQSTRMYNSSNKSFLCFIPSKHKSKDVIIYMKSVISSDTTNAIPPAYTIYIINLYSLSIKQKSDFCSIALNRPRNAERTIQANGWADSNMAGGSTFTRTIAVKQRQQQQTPNLRHFLVSHSPSVAWWLLFLLL